MREGRKPSSGPRPIPAAPEKPAAPLPTGWEGATLPAPLLLQQGGRGAGRVGAAFSRESWSSSGNERVFDSTRSCPRNEGKVGKGRERVQERKEALKNCPGECCERNPGHAEVSSAQLPRSSLPSVASSPGEAADTRELRAPASSGPS